jgi:NADH-quinone oxidoreductase subunit J
MTEQIIFYFLAALMVVFSVMAVTSKRIIRSAVYLLFVILGTAGLFLLMNFHFLFAVQIAVYAGGIMVLFIMAIFLTHKPDKKIKTQSTLRMIPMLLLSIGGVAISGFIIWKNVSRVYNVVDSTEIDMHLIGTQLMGYEKYQYLLPFEVISILLLACIIGAVLIARKDPNEEKQLNDNKEIGE